MRAGRAARPGRAARAGWPALRLSLPGRPVATIARAPAPPAVPCPAPLAASCPAGSLAAGHAPTARLAVSSLCRSLRCRSFKATAAEGAAETSCTPEVAVMVPTQFRARARHAQDTATRRHGDTARQRDSETAPHRHSNVGPKLDYQTATASRSHKPCLGVTSASCTGALPSPLVYSCSLKATASAWGSGHSHREQGGNIAPRCASLRLASGTVIPAARRLFLRTSPQIPEEKARATRRPAVRKSSCPRSPRD